MFLISHSTSVWKTNPKPYQFHKVNKSSELQQLKLMVTPASLCYLDSCQKYRREAHVSQELLFTQATYFHWHKRKEVCDKVMDFANVKLLLVEIFRAHNRFSQEQEHIISNRELCHCLIRLSEFRKSWATKITRGKNKLLLFVTTQNMLQNTWQTCKSTCFYQLCFF